MPTMSLGYGRHENTLSIFKRYSFKEIKPMITKTGFSYLDRGYSKRKFRILVKKLIKKGLVSYGKGKIR